MKQKVKTLLIAGASLMCVAGLAGAGGWAWAAETGASASAAAGNDTVVAAQGATISLVEAITHAQAHTPGIATRAELEAERGRTVFQVEIVTADYQGYEVIVDAANGRVVSSRQDAPDAWDVDDDDEREGSERGARPEGLERRERDAHHER